MLPDLRSANVAPRGEEKGPKCFSVQGVYNPVSARITNWTQIQLVSNVRLPLGWCNSLLWYAMACTSQRMLLEHAVILGEAEKFACEFLCAVEGPLSAFLAPQAFQEIVPHPQKQKHEAGRIAGCRLLPNYSRLAERVRTAGFVNAKLVTNIVCPVCLTVP
jgi:hypothetical protein